MRTFFRFRLTPWACGLLACQGVALVVSGCAAQQPKQLWYKDGSTAQDYYQDDGACRAQAFAAPTLVQVVIIRDACMQSKGWYLR